MNQGLFYGMVCHPMTREALQHAIERLPRTAGVYVFRSRAGTPLYIGKAANLRTRVSNYRRPTDPRIAAMVKAAAKLTWTETDTDIEALILESQLIKKLKPRYNIDWRDDKNYFYVAVTDEEFPQLILTHQHQQTKIRKPIKELIGPFTDGVPLKVTLRVLRNLFPTCTCKQKHHLRCLNAHIGKCPGYCCLKMPATVTQKKEYAHNIRAVRDVLTGKRDVLIRRLARTMPDIALKLFRVFKNAQINARNQRFTGHTDAPARVEGYDIANIQGQYAVGAMAVFTDGMPDKNEYRLFNIKIRGGDTDMLREMLERRLKHKEWPLADLVVIDGGKAQLNTAIAVFNKSKVEDVKLRIVAVTKDERHRAARVVGNIQGVDKKFAFAVDAEAHRFAVSRYRLRHRKVLK